MKESALTLYRSLDKNALGALIIIGIVVGFLSLVVPIAAQALVNIIAFSRVLQPVVWISLIVFIVSSFAGFLYVWQTIIIEVVMQRLFVNVGITLAEFLPTIQLSSLNEHRGPELVNRFFDVITINKVGSNLLLYGIFIVIQSLLGMVLFFLYHPWLLAFDVFLLVSLTLIIFVPFHTAVITAKEECTQKHEVGAWLEEILHNAILFKLGRNAQYALKQTDERIVAYLKARNRHFKMLILHNGGMYLLAALSSSLLLGIGGYLVIHNQLSLGQLVAAELVLASLTTGFKRMGTLLDDYYDLVASSSKIDDLFAIQTEANLKSIASHAVKFSAHASLSINVANLQTKSDAKSISFTASPQEAVLLYGPAGSGKTTVLQMLLGLIPYEEGKIIVNKHEMKNADLKSMRSEVALVSESSFFVGSIYDNLTLGHHVSKEKIMSLIERFGLSAKINALPHHLSTLITDQSVTLNLIDERKLMIIRALLAEPKVLLLDETLDGQTDEDCQTLLNALRENGHITLIVTSSQTHLTPFFETTVQV